MHHGISIVEYEIIEISFAYLDLEHLLHWKLVGHLLLEVSMPKLNLEDWQHQNVFESIVLCLFDQVPDLYQHLLHHQTGGKKKMLIHIFFFFPPPHNLSYFPPLFMRKFSSHKNFFLTQMI